MTAETWYTYQTTTTNISLWSVKSCQWVNNLVERWHITRWVKASELTELYSHTQSSTFSPELHQGPNPAIQIANGLGKSSQQKQTTQDYFILAALIVHWCVFVFVTKIKLPVMDYKTSFCRFSHIYYEYPPTVDNEFQQGSEFHEPHILWYS